MKHHLIIVEGLPCSGKSTLSAFAAECLKQQGKVCYVDEGTGDHPADYEFGVAAVRRKRPQYVRAGWIR